MRRTWVGPPTPHVTVAIDGLVTADITSPAAIATDTDQGHLALQIMHGKVEIREIAIRYLGKERGELYAASLAADPAPAILVTLTPERAIEVQSLLGSDIVMQLDECLKLPAAHAELERAMHLSRAWAERCKRAFERVPQGRALFGIVQGGDVPAL